MGIKLRHILIFAAVVCALAVLFLPRPREEGILQARSGNVDKAEELLGKVLQENPADSTVLLELAEGYMRVGQNARAHEFIALLHANFPDTAAFNGRLADIYLAGNEYAHALRLLELEPVKNRARIVALSIAIGELENAIAHLETGLRGDAADIPLWREILTLEQWRLNLGGAARALEMLAHYQPNEENLTAALDLYFWRNNPQKMREYATLLATLKAPDADTLRLLRTVWLRLREAEQALAVARAVCEMSGAEEADFLDLAALAGWHGEHELAARALSVGLAKFPGSEALLWQGMNLALAAKDTQKAAEFQKRLAALTENPDMLRAAATNYALAGDTGAAENVLLRLLDSPQGQTQDLLQLARLYLDSDRSGLAQEKGTELYRRLFAQEPGDITYDTLAGALDMFERLGRKDESGQLLQKLSGGGNDEARLLLSYYFGGAGQIAQALEQLADIAPDAPGDLRRRAAVQEAYLRSALAYDPKLRKQQTANIHAAKEAIARAFVLAGEFPPAGDAAAARAEEESLRGMLADFLLVEGDLDGARDIIAALPEPGRERIIELAARLAEKGRKAEAGEWLERAGGTEGLEPLQLSRLAYTRLLLGDKQGALEAYLLADRNSGGKEKEIRLGLAQAYGELGRRGKQYAILDHYLRLPEAEDVDWLRAAYARGAAGEYAAELALLQEGRGKLPESPVLLARVVSVLATLGEADEARTEALALSGMRLRKEPEALLTVAYALLAVEQIKEARRILIAAAKLEGDNPQITLARARCEAADREPERALALYREYLAQEEDDAAAWFELALLRRQTGGYGAEDAARMSRSILSRSEIDADGLALSSAVADSIGQRRQALDYAATAAQMQPQLTSRRLNLAALYNTYGQPARAQSIVGEILAEHPGATATLAAKTESARSLSQLRRPAQSIRTLREIIEARPAEPAPRAELAYALADSGNWRQAAGQFRMAEILTTNSEAPADGLRAASAEILCEEVAAARTEGGQ